MLQHVFQTCGRRPEHASGWDVSIERKILLPLLLGRKLQIANIYIRFPEQLSLSTAYPLRDEAGANPS